MRSFAIVLVTLPFLLAASAAHTISTAEQVLNDPNRPVTAVAAELGVTPMQFASCFAGVTPARTAAELDGAREQDNKAVLLPCLREINPGIDNDLLDRVMDKYRGPPPN